jgi:hypothetical protein
MKYLFLTALLCASGIALAQEKKPVPAGETAAKEKPASEQRRPLNLRLDNPSQYVTEVPVEKSAPGALPSLGADARTLPSGAPASSSSRPYPKDTERGER